LTDHAESLPAIPTRSRTIPSRPIDLAQPARRFLLIALTVLPGVAGFGQSDSPAESRRVDRLQRMLRSPRENIRLEAVHQLEHFPVSQRLNPLIHATQDPAPAVREAAATALQRSRHPRATAAVERLLQDPVDTVRAAAVTAICYLDGRRFLPTVIEIGRTDSSPRVRFRAIAGVGIIREKSALPAVVAALADVHPAVRERAALATVDLLADPTLPGLLRPMASHHFPPTRRLVMQLYARHGTLAQCLPVLKTGLQDADPLVRSQAALSLGKRRVTDVGPGLLPLLRDPDEHVRGTAAYALGLIGDRSALASLRALLADESAAVRAVAAESLQKLGDGAAKPPTGFRGADLYADPF
jgi:HEAT repeat protein